MNLLVKFILRFYELFYVFKICFFYVRSLLFAKMPKIYIKTYNNYAISGKDFATVTNSTMRRIIFTPDNTYSVAINELRDGCLCIVNDRHVPFEFSLSRAHKVIAVVNLRLNENVLRINTNWRLTENGVENREIHSNPNLVLILFYFILSIY